MEVVHDLVSSGVVGALLFRVGRGQDRNPRFNKLVAHFLHQMLQKVMLYQEHRGYHMALQVGSKNTKLAFYLPRGEECPPPSEAFLAEKQALIDRVNIPFDATDGDSITPMVPSTAPLSRIGTAPQASLSGGGATGQSSTQMGKSRQRKISILDEALANQANDRLQEKMREGNEALERGQWSGTTGQDFQTLTIDTAGTDGEGHAAEFPEGGINSPKHNPGFTPGPGFRKKLVNKDAEFDFPTDEDGVPIHPPASPMSPINMKHNSGGHVGSRSEAGSTKTPVSFGLNDSIDFAEASGTNDTIGDAFGTFSTSTADCALPIESGVVEQLDGGKSQSTAATGMESGKVKEIYRKKLLQQSTDLRSISNTLTAQGVVESFFSTLEAKEGEDPDVVKESLLGLAILDFNAYYEIATEKSFDGFVPNISHAARSLLPFSFHIMRYDPELRSTRAGLKRPYCGASMYSYPYKCHESLWMALPSQKYSI